MVSNFYYRSKILGIDFMKELRVLVTGSTSGIGLAIAEEFAKAGHAVMLHGLGHEPPTLPGSGKKGYSKVDLSTQDGPKQLVAETIKTLGGIDVLVNNAGIQHVAKVEEFSDEKWNQVIAINLSAGFHAAHEALPHMKNNSWGRIINIASVHGLVASMNKAAYVSSKHGIIGLTKVIALENAGHGVTCNAVCPGWVLTPLVQKQIDDIAAAEGITVPEAEKKLLLQKQPSGEFVKPSDIGQLCLFLCSGAANQITGTAIPIDGGWTAQ